MFLKSNFIRVNRTRNDDLSPRGYVKCFQCRNPKERCYVCCANLHQLSWARPACVLLLFGFLVATKKKNNDGR